MADIEVKVPDIGDFKDVPVIEVLVKPGDAVTKEQSLVTLESDKATMEVPSPAAGMVKAVTIKVGDKVSEGSVVLTLEAAAAAPAALKTAAAAPVPAAAPAPAAPPAAPAPVAAASAPPPTLAPAIRPAPIADAVSTGTPPHASPGVRRFARELGVDLTRVKGSGPKERILKEDIQAFVKTALAGEGVAAAPRGSGGGGLADLGLPAWPKVDFAKFGPIEPKPLSRIKKLSGANLHRNWVMIPHVTNNDEADITDLEAFRVSLNKESDQTGVKYTMLGFLIKAVVAALKKYPEFNASLDGDQLVYKHYYHIGFAADTPNGLVVPVLKDADKKGL